MNSAFVTALLTALKADEVPAAQMIENLILAAVADIPMALPAADQALAATITAASMPELKAFLDALVAKLAPATK